jgi:hypothetical protein
MDENQIIRSAPGGCGSLIDCILHSNNDERFDVAVACYRQQQLPSSSLLQNSYGRNGVAVIWDNIVDASFCYFIENPNLTQINRPPTQMEVSEMVHKISSLEAMLKGNPCCWSLTQLLQDVHKLHDHCRQINPEITLERTRTLFSLWRDTTCGFYERNAEYVLDYFNQLPWQVVDYSPDTIYNILYANTNP